MSDGRLSKELREIFERVEKRQQGSEKGKQKGHFDKGVWVVDKKKEVCGE